MNHMRLSQSEKYCIYTLLKAGRGLSEIVSVLRKRQSIIYRKLSHNSGLMSYNSKQAELLASQRSEHSRNGSKTDRRLWQSVTVLLNEKLSLDQISAQLEVSHKTIYKYVYVDRSPGGDLYRDL